MLNTFDDYLINLAEYYKIKTMENCVTLLVADCSPYPEMAVFLLPSSDNGLSSNYGLRVHIGEHYFTYNPRNNSIKDNSPVYITLNKDSEPIDIRLKPYQYPKDTKTFDFR